MKRHVGKMARTDQRCVVVFMQIPNRETHALIVTTDGLPPRFEQAVMEVLESPEGQNDETLANVLARRLMPDNGKTVLQALHEGQHLRAVPIGEIVMLPMPGMPFPLEKVLADMGRGPAAVAGNAMTEALAAPDRSKFNPHEVNNAVSASEGNRGIAQNLLIEAEMLESDARRKRETAYRYAPDLAPHLASSPVSRVGKTKQTKPVKQEDSAASHLAQSWGHPGTAEYENRVAAEMAKMDAAKPSARKPTKATKAGNATDKTPAKRMPRAAKQQSV